MVELHASFVAWLMVMAYLIGTIVVVAVLDLSEREVYAFLGVTMWLFILTNTFLFA